MDFNLIAQIFAYVGLSNLTKFSQISVKYRPIVSRYQYIISLSAKDVNELLIRISNNKINYHECDNMEIVKYCLLHPLIDLLYKDCKAFHKSCDVNNVEYIKLYLDTTPKLFDKIDWRRKINDYLFTPNRINYIKLLMSYEEIYSQLSDNFMKYVRYHYSSPIEQKIENIVFSNINFLSPIYSDYDSDDLRDIIGNIKDSIEAYYFETEDKNQCLRLFQLLGLIKYDNYSRIEIREIIVRNIITKHKRIKTE